MKDFELLDYKNWVVVGDVLNESKYAYKILEALKDAGFHVKGYNPKIKDERLIKELKDIPYKINVVDLCINPVLGLEVLKEAEKLKIDKVLIQPGAGSKEILSFCKDNGIIAVEGCALVALSNR